MTHSTSRRSFLFHLGGGLGGIALANYSPRPANSPGRPSQPAFNGGLHHPAKVKRVIQLFMNGGVSSRTPSITNPNSKRPRQAVQPGWEREAEGVTSTPGNLMKSPFPFKQHGQSGGGLSSIFPHLATRVDRMAFSWRCRRSRTFMARPAT